MNEITITEWLRSRCLARVITNQCGHKQNDIGTLRKTEWSDRFEALMRNRLLMGYFRYGAMNDPAKGNYDIISSAIARLEVYRQSGNLEHLVDVANLCLVEFVHSKHPLKHFDAQDDGKEGRCLRASKQE